MPRYAIFESLSRSTRLFQEMWMSLKTRAILVLVIGAVMGVGLSAGGAFLTADRAVPVSEDAAENARLFTEVMQRVKREFVEPVDDRVLLESAIRGMVSDLDAHSQYLDEDEYRDIRISTTGNYSGVGIEVSTLDGEVRVVTPIDNTPAERAGIKAGDTIVSIDGIPVDSDRLHRTIDRMRGRPGSGVTIAVERDSEPDPLVFVMKRENIHVSSVRHELLDSSVGYVRVSQFNESTPAELSDAVDELMDEVREEDGLRGLVLDLRNNPGGILDAAVEVSDLFLDDGVIVTADGRTPESRFTKRANRGDILDGASLIVLVNRGSASASEIVAGALQDHRRALIIGTGTFGKGLVQTVMPLSKGRAIKLTTSRYYTPSGDSIHETGISPDVYIEGSGEHPVLGLSSSVDREGDPQLLEALERLRRLGVMHSKAS
jgi:carboxyl-terminal processing protease